MKKRYLKTPKEVIALKDTNVKIYAEYEKGYYQFIDGVLCAYDDDDENDWSVNVRVGDEKLYVLEEEPMLEASEKDVGKLCWFKDDNGDAFVAILEDYDKSFELPCECNSGWYKHCHPLTKEEIKEFMEKAE